MNKKLLLLGLIPTLLLSGCGNPSTDDRKITLNRESLTLAVDDTYQLKTTLEGFSQEQTELLIWSSSNDIVATVDNGLITAIS